MTRIDYECLSARRPEFKLPKWHLLYAHEQAVLQKLDEKEITRRCTEAILTNGRIEHWRAWNNGTKVFEG